MKKRSLFIILFVLSCCVVKSEQLNSTIVTFDIPKTQEATLTDIYSSADLIQLKSNNMIVPKIEQLHIDNHCIILKGSNKYMNQYLYKRNGDYIADLGQLLATDVPLYKNHNHSYYSGISAEVYVNSKKRELKFRLKDYPPKPEFITMSYDGKISKIQDSILTKGYVAVNINENNTVKDIQSMYNLQFRFNTESNEKVELQSAFVYKDHILLKYVLSEVIPEISINLYLGTYYAVYNLKTEEQYAGIETNGVFTDTDVRILGVCDDGFVFTVDNPWNAKVTEKGVSLLTNNAKKIIKQINEDSDYILLIMKP